MRQLDMYVASVDELTDAASVCINSPSLELQSLSAAEDGQAAWATYTNMCHCSSKLKYQETNYTVECNETSIHTYLYIMQASA